MTEILLIVQHQPKNGPTLVPVDEPGWEWLAKKKQNQVIACNVRAPRNIDHHRKFFALLNLVYQNQEHYKSVDDILLAFKYHCGMGHWVVCRDKKRFGHVVELWQPESISFAKMDQTEFDAFYKKAMDFVCTVIIPNMDSEALEQELLGFV